MYSQKCDFSLGHYREILIKAVDLGFQITNFRDYQKLTSFPKVMILRHDIDYSPKRALDLAIIDNQLKIKSTFYVRVHGEYYHPFDRINYLIFKEIIKLNHEIGLHFEARNLSLIFKTDMVELFLQEKNILERILKIKVDSAAEHGDFDFNKNYWKNHFFTKIDKKQVGIKHFPQEEIYKDFYYISDSRQIWKNGCLCQNFEKYDKIQALIHGDLWGKNAVKERNYLLKTNPILKSSQFKGQYQRNFKSLFRKS